MYSYIGEQDRNYIENKYHLQSEPHDPHRRFQYHGDPGDESTGFDDKTMLEGLTELFRETKGDPHPIAKAKSFSFVLDHMRIGVSDFDYFPLLYNWGRLPDPTFIQPWYREAFDSIPEIRDQKRLFTDSGTAAVMLDMDHVVPDYREIFRLGFPGLLERINRYRKIHKEAADLSEEQTAFLNAVAMEYEAILRLLERFRDYAARVPGQKPEKLAGSLGRLIAGPPETFLDALELLYFYFMLSESVDQYQARSLGNGLDRTLFQFFRSDLGSGRSTETEIRSYLAFFFLQFYAIGNYWNHPFYIVGTDFDGKTDISAFTHLILDVYESLNIHNPKIQVKLDVNTPPDLIRHVLNTIRRGHTSFVFVCVPGMKKALTSCYGVTEEEAENADISGCNEMHVLGDEACMNSAVVNAAKAVTYVFTDGFDPVTGRQVGPHTGPLGSFTSFESFWDAYQKQFAYILDSVMEMARVYEPLVAEINPSLMLSGVHENSLKTSSDAYAFAVKYPTSALELAGLATAADSLNAVRTLVFRDCLLTLEALKEALDANWEGFEALRLKARKLPCKYGSGDPEGDESAVRIYRFFAHHVNGQPNGRGGVFKTGTPSTLHFISLGKLTEATPDGRKRAEEISRNVAPVIGTERKGVTGLIRSALALQPSLFSESFVLDVMLHPSAVTGDEGLNAMEGILKTYLKGGGISIQFNIFDASMLRDAKAHPERYEHLEVRVSGWNVLWNRLSEEEQDAYILRAESLE